MSENLESNIILYTKEYNKVLGKKLIRNENSNSGKEKLSTDGKNFLNNKIEQFSNINLSKNENHVKNYLCEIKENNFITKNNRKRLDYIKLNPEINECKRIILLDWVMGVCYSNNFKRETFYLTVQLIDSFFCTVKNIKTDEIQLIGDACLLLACKYNEVNVPSIRKFSEFTANSFSCKQILNYESKILKALKWIIKRSEIYEWAHYILFMWNKYSKENYKDLYIVNKNINKELYYLYYFLLDSIILDYKYRFKDFNLLCTWLLFLLFCFHLNLLNEQNYLMCQSKFECIMNLDFTRYYFSFVEKNEKLNLEDSTNILLYVLNFIDLNILNYIKINNINKNFNIDLDNQDYNKEKIILVKLAIKKLNNGPKITEKYE